MTWTWSKHVLALQSRTKALMIMMGQPHVILGAPSVRAVVCETLVSKDRHVQRSRSGGCFLRPICVCTRRAEDTDGHVAKLQSEGSEGVLITFFKPRLRQCIPQAPRDPPGFSSNSPLPALPCLALPRLSCTHHRRRSLRAPLLRDCRAWIHPGFCISS